MNRKKGAYGQGGGSRRLPAIDFPVYQASDQYQGRWWVGGMQITRDGFASMIWAGQQAAQQSGESVDELLAGTLHRQRYHDFLSGTDPLFAVADLCLTTLINAHPERVEASSDVLAYAHQHADWPTVTWFVDGQAVNAAVCRHDADIWVGFTDGLTNAYLAVVGKGAEPDDLRFVQIEDSNLYGVDLTAPVNVNDIGRPNT